jgi:hypothetical protein
VLRARRCCRSVRTIRGPRCFTPVSLAYGILVRRICRIILLCVAMKGRSPAVEGTAAEPASTTARGVAPLLVPGRQERRCRNERSDCGRWALCISRTLFSRRKRTPKRAHGTGVALPCGRLFLRAFANDTDGRALGEVREEHGGEALGDGEHEEEEGDDDELGELLDRLDLRSRSTGRDTPLVDA